MNSYAKVLAAALAVIAVGAFWVTFQRSGTPSNTAGVVTPSPFLRPSGSSRATISPSVPPASVLNRASAFMLPFNYTLPITPTFDLGATTERYFEVRVPEWADAGHPGGLIVQAIGGGRIDPCDEASDPLALDDGPDAVFDYLATIPALTITDDLATTVDGRRARQATVTAAETDGCPNLHIWAEEGEPFITGTSLRLVAMDVEGEHIVVTTFGEPYIPGWPALADHIIGSIRFGYLFSSPAP